MLKVKFAMFFFLAVEETGGFIMLTDLFILCYCFDVGELCYVIGR